MQGAVQAICNQFFNSILELLLLAIHILMEHSICDALLSMLTF